MCCYIKVHSNFPLRRCRICTMLKWLHTRRNIQYMPCSFNECVHVSSPWGGGEGTRRNAADACPLQSGGPTPRPRCRPLDPRARWPLGPTDARVQDPTDALICAHVSSPQGSRRISNETQTTCTVRKRAKTSFQHAKN